MNYKILRSGLISEFIEKVNKEDKSLLKLYLNQESFDYDFKVTDILESNIKIINANLGKEMLDIYRSNKSSNTDADFECAKLLFESLPITESQASDANLWNYLHHFDLYKYIQNRWKNQGNLQTHIKRHWLMNLTSQKHLINFPLSTLWWSIYLTVDETRADKYELSKVYFSNNRFRTVSLGGMSFVRHRDAIISVLDFMKNHKEHLTKNTTYTDLGDDISKFVNLLGGTKPLSFFNQDWFTKKLEERYNIGSENKQMNFDEIAGAVENQEKSIVLCYFCLNNSGNPNYMISEERRTEFDYCIEINSSNKNGFLLHFYSEGKIKKTKINSNLIDKAKNKMYSNGKCNKLDLIGLKIVASDFLYGMAYTKNGVTKFKAMDGKDASIFRIDNDSLGQEGKKVLYIKEYTEIKFKLLPYSIKDILGTLVQTPNGKGADITNKYHDVKWKELKKHWPELFDNGQKRFEMDS